MKTSKPAIALFIAAIIGIGLITSISGQFNTIVQAASVNQSEVCVTCADKTPLNQPPTPILYTSMNGDPLSLYPYSGEKVALLVPNLSYDESVLTNMVSVYDDAYSFYEQATGRQPVLHFNHNGLDTIAVVPTTCGFGCGFLGATGIEVVDWGFDNTIYHEAAINNTYDQTIFYELGRNFWFYSNQLEYKPPDSGGSVVTGYAVYMRFKAMDAANITPAPFNGIPFADFRAEVEALLQTYLANPSYNWSNTLKVGQGVPNTMGLGATDLFASFMFELEAMFGQEFVVNFWQEVETRPSATTTQDAVDNFIIAASMTANTNLEQLFTVDWRWPISPEASQELSQYFDSQKVFLPIVLSPEPIASLPSGQATILDGFTNYGQSGFQFSTNSVVAWDAGVADILAAKLQTSLPIYFFIPYDAPPYNDPDTDGGAGSGIIAMAQTELEQVSECPESGYTYHWAAANLDTVYCVRTRDGEHYAIIKVTSIGNNSLSFTWEYQPDGSRSFHR